MNPVFIAEVSSNHHRDLGRCLQFIDTAADIGCDAVKFQLFRIEELFAPEILQNSAVHRKRKEWELPIDFLPPMAKHCHDKGLQFSCTPFYLKAVDELEPYVDFYKIASYELLWSELLLACASTGKPVILSTGMATLAEVSQAVATLKQGGCQELTLLHCLSGYPAPVEQCNLRAMETLRQEFGCPVGWSDHSVSPAVINRAVHRWQGQVIEFHLDLEGAGEEFTTGHCWLPAQIQPVISDIRRAFSADGSGEKCPSAAELPDREWRADPRDGLRPLRCLRDNWHG